MPAAHLVTRRNLRGRGFVRAAVVLTFVSPPFIGSNSWVILLGRSGLPSIHGALANAFVPPAIRFRALGKREEVLV